MTVLDRSGDTSQTEDDIAVEALRRQGILGPFVVTDWHAASDTGCVRVDNEDRWLADPARGFVVADGMGGHAGGKQAAEAAASCLFDALDELSEATAGRLIDGAHTAVVRCGEQHGYDQLGSTVCALAPRRTHAVIVNVGDSRAYRWRDGELELLTRDHSVRAELLAAGIPLETAIESNVRLDALTSFIGRRSQLSAPFLAATFSVMAGDRYLLCTDGVHDHVDAASLEHAMAARSCRTSVTQLLDRARSAGGYDNATAIAITFGNEDGI